MPEQESETVDQLILDHLDEAKLAEPAGNLVLGAVLGTDEFAAVLGGSAVAWPATSRSVDDASKPIGTYLESIEVTGFRGIGPTAVLTINPGPGLTIVTGRNGSGKSSFAEAAEFALTGDNQRWSGRTAIWQDGWRNLHTTGESVIRVRLGIEGQRNGAAVECHWKETEGLTSGTAFLQVSGRRRQTTAELGWERPLKLYRPFLSYAELGGLLSGKPSEMHDSLQRILGLDRLVEIEGMLKAARKDMDARRKTVDIALPALREALAAHPDARAREAEQALAEKTADLERLTVLGSGTDATLPANSIPLRQLDVLQVPDRQYVVDVVDRIRAALLVTQELSGTQVEDALAVSGLLRDALRHHEKHAGQPCPVCGGRTLDDSWASQAQVECDRLTERAKKLDDAVRLASSARKVLREQVAVVPPALSLDLTQDGVDCNEVRARWQQWDALMNSADTAAVADAAIALYDSVLDALVPVQTAARRALERRQQQWQPAADRIRAWIAIARDSRLAAEMFRALQEAILWLQKVGDQIRNDQLMPVAAEATSIWNMLRQESNVSLDCIRLSGTGTSRRVDLNVSVDGISSAALGVMSQGELHSLALALFLPRATKRESPFRFLVIDDPVQSMDPVKVYGLAKVLDQVAKNRQVIVFTHDDRLPAAIRQLQLDARIVTVSRLMHSRVAVEQDEHSKPASRYLDSARAITKDENMAENVRTMIVSGLIRDALESSCHEVVRRRDFRAGVAVTETERAIGEADRGVRSVLALAIGDATGEGRDDALRRLHPDAPNVVRLANGGAHGSGRTALSDLVKSAERVIERLDRS
jgi:recombinational DNA repair ATPase RecF